MRIKALGWLSMAKECWLRQGWRWFADIVHFPLSEMMTPKDEYWVKAINPNLVREQRCTLQLGPGNGCPSFVADFPSAKIDFNLLLLS